MLKMVADRWFVMVTGGLRENFGSPRKKKIMNIILELDFYYKKKKSL